MSTDPFDDVKRPISGEYQEISQSTFVELISAKREYISPVIRSATPSVNNSLARVAFGRSCAGTTKDPSTHNQIIAIPQQTQSLSYTLQADAQAYHKKVAGLAAAKSNTDIRSLVFNSLVAGVCPLMPEDPCFEAPCPIDFVLCLDNSRNGLPSFDNVKQGIEDFIFALADVVDENMRLGIVTFADYLSVKRYLWYTHVAGRTEYQCIDALNGFVSILRYLELQPHGYDPTIGNWSAHAVRRVLEGLCGPWRVPSTVAYPINKIIMVVTPTYNDDYTGDTALSAAIHARDCGVKVIYVLVPAGELFTPPKDPAIIETMIAEGETYEAYTGGTFIHVNANGTGIPEALESWVDLQCDVDVDPCVPGEDDVCSVDLAIVLDDTGSMGGTIDGLKDGIPEVISILQEAIGNNFRLSLTTFKDNVTTRESFSNKCGTDSYNAFTAALSPVYASGGGGLEEYSAAAIKHVAEGNSGAWRTSALRAMLVLTDAPNNISSGVTYIQAAAAAAAQGIKIAYAGTPFHDATQRTEGEYYAATTEGIVVETNNAGDNLKELLTTWVYGLCAADIPVRECEGGTDYIVNGEFNANISGWNIITQAVYWDSAYRAMVIQERAGSLGEARQTISGLTFEDRMVLSATLTCGSQACDVIWGVHTQRTEEINLAANESVRVTMSLDVPFDGEMIPFFALKSTTPSGSGVYFRVDDVIACVYKVDECGPGSRNLVSNPNFTDGVEFWTDGDDVDLPATDPAVWDSVIQAIVVNLSAYEEVRTALTATGGKDYTLIFNVVSNQPDTIPEVGFIYGLLDSSDTVIAQGSKNNSNLGTLPQTITLNFTAPSDGDVRIFFKTGAIGGVTKINSVLVCDQVGECEPGYSKLSFDDFTEDKGGWGGGQLRDGQLVLWQSGGGGFPSCSQVYYGLEPRSIVSATFDLRSESYLTMYMKSGDVTDQRLIGPVMGQYTMESIVQATGSMTVSFSMRPEPGTTNWPSVYLDNILVCVAAPPACENNVSNLKAFVEWNGIPRRPFNLFNAFIRYKTRTVVDNTINYVTYSYGPTTEGHLGAATCDFWKQQGSNGVARDNVLATRLDANDVANAEDGDYKSVTSKLNWLWSIPYNGSVGQDSLTINLPDPPADALVESVTIFLLSQYCQPEGDDTTPVFTPPGYCDPDPAVSVNVGISYDNWADRRKEFTSSKTVNELWWQDVDFEQHLPNTWDTITPLNYGIKGSIARWDAYTFLLDAVDGTGLDQCTTPLDFDEEATKGELTFKKFRLAGTGRFVDSCLAIVEIDYVSSTSQGVYILRPDGGTIGGYFYLVISTGTQSDVSPGLRVIDSPEVLEAQLNSMLLWGDLDPVRVHELEPEDATVYKKWYITFEGVGPVEEMTPIYEETLICDPIILEPVPDGPYPYELPECDTSAIACSTGPLLCKPGEDDGTPVAETCCDQTTISNAANWANRLCVERDLFDPNRTGCCGGATTIRDLAIRKGLNPTEYVPYIRDWGTNTLSDASYSQTIKLGQSILLIENELDTEAGRNHVLGHLSSHREILPSRMYWPELTQ